MHLVETLSRYACVTFALVSACNPSRATLGSIDAAPLGPTHDAAFANVDADVTDVATSNLDAEPPRKVDYGKPLALSYCTGGDPAAHCCELRANGTMTGCYGNFGGQRDGSVPLAVATQVLARAVKAAETPCGPEPQAPVGTRPGYFIAFPTTLTTDRGSFNVCGKTDDVRALFRQYNTAK